MSLTNQLDMRLQWFEKDENQIPFGQCKFNSKIEAFANVRLQTEFRADNIYLPHHATLG